MTVAVSAFLLAFKGNVEKGSIAESICAAVPLQPKILQIEYYPRDVKSSRYLDAAETGFQNKQVIDQEAYVKNISNELVTSINEATKFHGYKDPSAPQFLKYSVVATKKYYTNIPHGYLLKPEEGVYRPNYNQILTQNNICDYVDNKGVTEVWMFGYHFGTIEPDESRMSGTYGDISNSQPKEEDLPAQYKMPVCAKPYVLYNYNYDRTALEMLHNKIHQLENILAYAEGVYPPTTDNTARGTGNFWGNFSEYIQPNTDHNSYKSSCGNAHYAPNWSSASDEYRYNSTTMKENNCETWNPDPSKSVYKMANCSQWGCTEKGYYMWYLQNMPGYNNGIEYDGQRVRNWWEALYNPVEFLDHGRTLLGESTYACITPTVTPSPTLTPASTVGISKPSPCNGVGDVNLDRFVNTSDVELILKHVAGSATFSPEQLRRADVSGDKTITLIDTLQIRQYIAGQINTFIACRINPTVTATPAITKKPTVSTSTVTNTPRTFRSTVKPNDNTVSIVYKWGTTPRTSCKGLPNVVYGPKNLTSRAQISPNSTSAVGVAFPSSKTIYYCASVTYGAGLTEYGSVLQFTNR